MFRRKFVVRYWLSCCIYQPILACVDPCMILIVVLYLSNHFGLCGPLYDTDCRAVFINPFWLVWTPVWYWLWCCIYQTILYWLSATASRVGRACPDFLHLPSSVGWVELLFLNFWRRIAGTTSSEKLRLDRGVHCPQPRGVKALHSRWASHLC